MTDEQSMQERILRNAVAAASRAPSVHNTQPWSWTLRGDRLDLFADPERQMQVADPTGRQMIISCGAMLHHLCVNLHDSGYDTTIERMPDAEDPQHLAAVTVARARYIDERNRALAKAILERRSDRRPLGALSTEVIEQLRASYHDDDVSAVPITSTGKDAFRHASEVAVAQRLHDEQYQRELSWWSGHYRLFEGVPRSSLVASGTKPTVPSGRDFPAGTLTSEHGQEDQAALFVLSTSGDTAEDWLRCGEAMSAMLLAATIEQLGACPVTHVTELEESRAIVREATASEDEMYRYPQVVIRIGERLDPAMPPQTGRRPLDEILQG
ncbi:NAD(P)H nitroreductase [Hoyosella sp. G463]|uniref:NAD(P)H nitroreductase n=1 Tax=Lolliginicoccus lacisalsi TaxID=2742202 RepID=A0A927JDB4_9ACTN|nr:NAD(P)H nitroreductase [Lolliginicoccus lacisalsi]MBD8506552.1 NAD(P)H nitroreductase [Lolliginicoccus lacisalsi]